MIEDIEIKPVIISKVKTLEELGYKLVICSNINFVYEFWGKETNRLPQFITLISNGEYHYDCNCHGTEESHKAISLKMKELGWWK